MLEERIATYAGPMANWTIERMTPAGWERVRAIRLRALADAPDAFGTLLAEDTARRITEWRTRLERADTATFLAVVDGIDCGLATGSPWEGAAGDAGLYSMWVAPEQRGRGLGGAIVDTVVAWARAEGHARILLDVGDGNAAAIALYASRGFEPTGTTSTLPPPRDHLLEHERALVL